MTCGPQVTKLKYTTKQLTPIPEITIKAFIQRVNMSDIVNVLKFLQDKEPEYDLFKRRATTKWANEFSDEDLADSGIAHMHPYMGNELILVDNDRRGVRLRGRRRI